MSIFAIADLHLSFGDKIDKPMDVFGPNWENHAERVKEEWEKTVTSDDTVIIAGDISWALKEQDAMADLDWIHALPGEKVLIKGNHELWWMSTNRLNKLYEKGMYFVQNNFHAVGETAICGSRGWICPGTEGFSQHDEKIYARELLRLKMSLDAAQNAGYTDIIGVLHYPPTNESHQPSGFTELFEKYKVRQVVYGHLHGKDIWPRGLQAVFNGVDYRLVSLDKMKAKLLKLR